MKSHSFSRLPVAMLTSAVFLFAGSVWAAGQMLRVTNDGTDSASCGNSATPCRSISQAIENASAGDTIEVGAGVYGDISGDGTFTHPGDERPQLLPSFPSFTHRIAGCIVCITKPLHIFSLHGASVTNIVGIPSATYPTTVLIASPGVTFGDTGNGFTVTGGNGAGVAVDQNFMADQLQKNIRIAGNADIGDGIGFAFIGLLLFDQPPCSDPRCDATAAIFFTNNQATDNPGAGFVIVDSIFAGTIVLKSNLASGAGTGFDLEAGFQTQLGGTGHGTENVSLTDNVASHNGYGFSTVLTDAIVGNTAVGNSRAGFLAVPGRAFAGNSAIGNAGPGLIVQDSADQFDDGIGTTPNQFTVFSQNNFYGNDRDRPLSGILPPIGGAEFNPGPSAHCGVLNVGKLANPEHITPRPTITQTAVNNFWGSPRGPSTTGPADAVGGACDQNGGVTISKSFAPVSFSITTVP